MLLSKPSPTLPILEARGLRKVYGTGDAQTESLRGVDLTLRCGEFLAIMGPSGSGKSTLLHLIGGMEPPTAGSVSFEGRPFSELDDDSRSIIRRRRIGFVFQRINLLPTLTAQENVALPLLLNQQSRGAALQKALAALRAVNLEHRKKHLPHAMSGGEKQRVAIARALAIDPVLILADEPTGALDTAMGQEVMKQLRAIVDDRRSLVVVTHDPRVAEQADRRLIVRDGRIESESPSFGK